MHAASPVRTCMSSGSVLFSPWLWGGCYHHSQVLSHFHSSRSVGGLEGWSVEIRESHVCKWNARQLQERESEQAVKASLIVALVHDNAAEEKRD